MKIFFVDPQSYNNLSVYDTSLLGCIHNHEVTYYHNVKYQCERLSHIRYKGYFSYSDKQGVAKALSYCMSIVRLMCDVVREKPDVVHVQWFRLFAIDALLVLLLRLLHIRIVFTAHNFLPHDCKRYEVRQYAWYYRHVDVVIAHTRRTCQQIVDTFRLSEHKVHHIPHGMLVSIADADAVEARAKQLKAELNSEGKLVFGCMGRQNYYKGIDIVSDVWGRSERLHDSDDCLLLIIGLTENANTDALRSYPNVHVVDAVLDDVDFDAYFSLLHVALLPYREISQSGVLFTALQRGIPVVVTNCGGLPDPLGVANVGWNIGEANADNVEQILLQLLNNPDEICKIKSDNEAFAKIRTVFSWESIALMTEKLYQ